MAEVTGVSIGTRVTQADRHTYWWFCPVHHLKLLLTRYGQERIFPVPRKSAE